MKENGTSVTATRVSQPSPSVQGALPETKPLQASAPAAPEKNELSKAEQPVPPVTEPPLKVIPLTQEKGVVDKAGAEGFATGGFLREESIPPCQ